MAHKVTDALKREWTVSLNLATIDAIEEHAGFTLDSVIPKVGSSKQEDFIPWHEFLANTLKQFDMFYALVHGQLNGLTKKELIAGFSTDEATDAMSAAVIGSIIDFFLRRDPPRAAMMRESVKINAKLMATAAKRIEEAMGKLNLDKLAESVPTISTEELMGRATEALEKSHGNAPVSAA